MREFLAIVMALVLAAGSLLAPVTSTAQSKGEIVIGVQCDRTGRDPDRGHRALCPGFHDYIALVNSKGGVEGYKIKALEIDHEYKVPPAVESYERFKKEGAVSIAVYGTPQIYALAAKLTEDRIPGTSPGFGSAAAADGTRYPYIFPIAATYWSQATAAVDFVKKQFNGEPQGQEDRVHLLRQPRRPRADPGAPGPRGQGRVPAQGIRRPASRRGDGRPGARHRAAVSRGLRDRASVRRGPRGVDQGVQARRAIRSARSCRSCGAPPRRTSTPPAASRWPRATTRCSSPASGPTTRC